MSSGPMYQSLTGIVDPTQLCGDTSAGIVSTDWYTPGVYSYPDPYIAPYAAATGIDQQSWNQHRSSGIGQSYALLQSISLDSESASNSLPNQQTSSLLPPSQSVSHQPQLHSRPESQQASPRQLPTSNHSPHNLPMKALHRPPSSQSIYDNIPWAPTNALGIQYSNATGLSTPATSTFPPAMFATYPIDEESHLGTSSPDLQQSKLTRPYPSIAPHPNAGSAGKRHRDDEDQQHSQRASLSGPSGSTHETTPPGSSKRRKRTASVISADLNEDDRFLVQLKEDESLPWKDIANRFLSDKGKTLQVAALQMRYKRLREKFRTWEDQDMNALKLAHEYWEKYKWEIISAKMLDFGVEERWPVRQCARKWQELDASTTALAHNTPLQNLSHLPQPVSIGAANNSIPRAGSLALSTGGPSILTPALTASQFSSPIETTAPMQYSFLPMQ